MILLQTKYDFFSNSDSTTSYIGLAVFAALILFAVVASLLGNKNRGKRGRSGSGGRMSFARHAKKLGLYPTHIRALQHMIRTQNIQSPEKLLDAGAYLNRAIREELEAIDADAVPQGEREARKNVLLHIKAILDANRTNLSMISSSRNIRIGQDVKIVFEGGGAYETTVTSNLANMLGFELPQDDEKPLRPEKGKRVQVTFLRDNNRVYRYITKVRGLHTVRGKGTLFVEHVTEIKQVQKRRSPRREFGQSAYFFIVQIMETGTGRKAKRQAVVQKARHYLGRIEDISSGGCLLRTQRPLKKGSLIRIDFQSDSGKAISVFGKVCGVQVRPPYGGDMHIQFTKVSQSHMNEIMSFVYGFSE
jgi:hypothetical protein